MQRSSPARTRGSPFPFLRRGGGQRRRRGKQIKASFVSGRIGLFLTRSGWNATGNNRTSYRLLEEEADESSSRGKKRWRGAAWSDHGAARGDCGAAPFPILVLLAELIIRSGDIESFKFIERAWKLIFTSAAKEKDGHYGDKRGSVRTLQFLEISAHLYLLDDLLCHFFLG
ncbi:uncharacterized protein LOC110430811 isoform X1 [Sorghum bicolor]|nr:uncharacterized protein LOC110430811 isoform X1 [Sorghum bicolor]|eukprot:XP_021304494.1 uncharacterized protein LOC110430811 isoform X1 [Sorghum bicolor]